jgi:WD40 repeat protein
MRATLEGHDDALALTTLVMHGDKLISSSDGCMIKVWSTDTWACERALEGNGGAVLSLMLHRYELLSGSRDRMTAVWGR